MKRLLTLTLSILLVLAALAGCNTGGAPSSSEENTTPSEPAEKALVRLIGLSGPTTMGMAKLLHENDKANAGNHYDFEMAAEASTITAAIAKSEVDIAVLPVNLASVLYNNTDGGVTLLAINNFGVLYVVETGDTIETVGDLAGKTLYATGKGTVPELTLNYLLAANGIDPVDDMTIEYKTDPSEVAAIMAQGEAIAMLPQPFVTVAMNANEDIRIALDINEVWGETVQGSSLVTGVAVVRTAFLQSNPEAVESFLIDYRASIDYVNDNVSEAAQLVGDLGIVPAPVAEVAIPLCNLRYMDGDAMQAAVSGYLEALYEQDPTSVGGNLPDDAFYYKR